MGAELGVPADAPAGVQDFFHTVLKKAVSLALFVVPVLLSAQTGERDTFPAGQITSVEVTGLKRTKTAVTDYALEKFIGRDAESLDINEVKAAVLDTGVLEPLSVDLAPEPGGVTLRVRVEEKWSVFPIPLLMISSGQTNFGLFLADTNAFGLRDQAAVGGMYGSDRWMGMALYRNTPERDGFPGWNAAFMYGSQNKEEQNQNERLLRAYHASLLRVSTGIEYPLTRELELSAAFSFTDISVSEPVLDAPREGNRNVGFSPGIAYRSASWDGYLLSERSLSFSYGYMLALLGSSFHELDMSFTAALPVVPGFLAVVKGRANGKPGADNVFEDGPRGVDILPEKFSALHYAGASAGLEKYLFKTRHGTLSAFASWQAVFSSGSLSGKSFDHGPAGGLRFYLSRVAIPALGFTMAYNMETSLPRFSFSIGMGYY
ncbi:MAG: hypothetical protein LBH35_07805 [Treponema sp.]|jgi:hypothetical protein|nr:hypothetical protein [Treponema sp.]